MNPDAGLRTDCLVPLSSVASEGHQVRPEFWAIVDDQTVFVTAVLERTVVYVAGSERRLTRRSNCLVDPARLVLHPITNTWGIRAKGSTGKAKSLDVENDIDEAEIELDSGKDENDDELSTAVGWSA